jgi:AAA domain
MSSNGPPIRLPNAVNRGRVVKAVYREPETADYAGNPLIEGLPPILTTEQAMLGLAYYPHYDQSQRSAPDHIRYHLIQNGLRFFAPLDIHLDLERRFSCLIRVGYAERNPLAIGFWNEVNARAGACSQYGALSAPRRNQWPSSAAGFHIVGMSGVGKSFSVERVLSLYPQVIHHSRYQGHNFTQSQITWLKLDCPFDGNTKGLCIEFFKAIDSLLGTNYHYHYAGKRRLQDELLSDMSLVAANHCLGVLVIDEIQRLSQARSGGAERMLNFFVQLVNTIGVPVVLIGTYKALSLLSGEFSQMRRGTGQGDLIWNRLDQDEQWQLFIESLWRFQYTRKQRLLKDDPALSDVLYDESQGITDFAVKLYLFAQERAIESGKEEVTAAVIRSAAKDKLRLPKPVLDALRRGDYRVLELYEDVYPPLLERRSLPKANEGDRSSPRAAPEKQPAKTMPESSPEPEVSPGAAGIPNRKQTRRQKGHAQPAIGTRGEISRLAALAAKQNSSVYDLLRQRGHLRPVGEYLPAGESPEKSSLKKG